MFRSFRTLALAVVGAVFLLGGVPLLTKQTFNPAEFQGQGCKGGLACFGMESEPAEQVERVPKDPSVGVRHRGLPSSVDLSSFLPPVGSQGSQGSCVGWSTTYYTKTLHEKVARQWSLDAGSSVSARCGSSATRIFSPAWTYNQINGGQDRGSSIYNAFQLLSSKGASSCSRMPYDVKNYTRQPDGSARSEAAGFVADSFKQIPCEDHDAIKAVLAKRMPVVGGFKVTKDMYEMGSSGVWDSFTEPVKGGHAMAVVGYDDSKRSDRGHRGAFKFVNSWGTSYGVSGFGWISYENWANVCKYTYVLYPKQGGGGEEPKPTPGPSPEPSGTVVKATTRVVATQGTYADRIVVSWEPAEGATAYEVQRSQGDSGFQSVGNAAENNYSDEGVQAGVAFRYRVVSIGESARSSPDDSPVAEGYAQQASPTPTRPGSVTGFTGSAESSGGRVVVSLSWTETAGATSYALLRHDANSRQWRTLSARATGTSYTDTGAPAGTVLHYAIRAQNNAGAGEFAMAEVKVGGGSRPPNVVTDLNATQGTRRDGILISWSATPGAAGYFLLRYDQPRWVVLGRTAGTSHLDNTPQATSGRQVYYTVVPFSQAGAGTYVDPVMGYTDRGTHRGVSPAAPEGLRVTARRGKTFTLAWKPSKGASEYYVFRKKQGSTGFQFVTSTGNKVTYTGEVPDTGNVYFYTVTAKSGMGGESARAPAVAAFANEPVAPVRRRFVPGQGLSRLAGTWSATHLTNTAAHKLVLEVSPSGADFVARLTRDGRETGTARGRYAMDSTSLVSGGFSLKLINDTTAVVRIDDRKMFPEMLRLTFVKGDKR